jgi:integral membrane protein
VAFALLKKIEATRPFTEPEAWGLFRLAALSEAVGWTILIIGIAVQKYSLPLHQYTVPIAGRIHGTIFLVYFAVLIATYSSLRWPRKKFVLAVLAGIPPYGTFVFEQWAAATRSARHRQMYFRSMVPILVLNTVSGQAS